MPKSLNRDPSAAAETLASTEATLPGDREREPDLPSAVVGTRIGRYVVLSRLGAGGMGVVFAAYDPELDRKVALKLLEPSQSAAASARTRLQREARALAKLAHPNVVSVHDVGTHGTSLFVAMEYVEGTTLAEWSRERRDWRQVVEVFLQAGRGLMAAHEVGLVHRDVKPDNMMLDARGVVRVMDFGLALGPELAPSLGAATDAPQSEPERADSLGPSVTRTGALTGTPAYMAPEQFSGAPLDARTDQFGFCVSLYEALYGERPFPGSTAAQLSRQVLNGDLRAAPEHAAVPTWLRDAVLRGIATEPEDRWPSMAALIEVMMTDPSIARRRWLVGIGGAVAIVAGTYGIVSASGGDEDLCKGMERRLAGTWDDERRQGLRAALIGTGVHHAEPTADLVEAALDEATTHWVDERRSACEATHARGEQSELLLDLRMACFDRNLRDLDVLVAALSRADAAVVDRAVGAVLGLPSPDTCADVDALMNEAGPDDPALAARVEALELELARALAEGTAGRYAAGLQIAEAAVAEARAVDYPTLQGRALRVRGRLLRRTGEYVGAERDAIEAYRIAMSEGRARDATIAANDLVFVLGYVLHRHAEARVWGIQSETLAESLDQQPALLADTYNGLALLAQSEGHFERARALHERVIELREQAGQAESPLMAMAYNNLGVAAFDGHDYEAAERSYRRALEIRERVLGPDHHLVAETLNNLGGLAAARNDLVGAQRYMERAFELRERAMGPEHPEVAATLDNLGAIAIELGELDVAEEYLTRAFGIFERTLGPDHESLAFTHINLSNMASARGQHERAIEHARRSLTIREQVLGPEHPSTIKSLDRLASVQEAARDHEGAHRSLARALAAQESRAGPDSIDAARTRVALARVTLELGRHAEALGTLDAAGAILQEADGEDVTRAEGEFVMARVLQEAPEPLRDRARSLELARSARERFAGAGNDQRAREIDDWLTSEGRRP